VIARADGYTVKIIHSSAGAENANAVQVANICLRHIQQAEQDAKTLTEQGSHDHTRQKLTLHKGYYGQTQNEHLFAPETQTNIGPHDHTSTQNTNDPAETLTRYGFARRTPVRRGGGGSSQKYAPRGLSHIVSVKVDAIGLGWGVVGLLEAWGREGLHGARIVGVNVAERALDSGKFRNQRAEMWWNGRVLLQPDGSGFQVVRLDVDRGLFSCVRLILCRILRGVCRWCRRRC
jgi:hypothetical protein